MSNEDQTAVNVNGHDQTADAEVDANANVIADADVATSTTAPAEAELATLEQNGVQNGGTESVNGDGEKDQVPGSTELPAEPGPTDDPAQKYLQRRQFVVQELIDTERDYARDLGQIIVGYMVALKEMQLPEDFQGKDKIVFGNIQQIYEFHRDTFSQELEKCLEAPDRVGSPFVRYERRLSTIYVKYCENKPKSDYIVSEYIDTIFEDVRQKLGHRLQLQDLLIKPVQRIMKYQLLLKDIMRHSERAGVDCAELKRALEVMHRVPKEANDMMQVGRLQGFPGKITALGKLLLQDTLQVAVVTPLEPTPKYKERRVFLFEQMIVFSDVSERKRGPVTYSTYTYKNSAEINNMRLRDRLEPPENESVKFMIMHRAKDGTETKFLIDPLNEENRATWMHSLNTILAMQRDFLTALQDPKQYLKGLSGSDEKPAASSATPPNSKTPSAEAGKKPVDSTASSSNATSGTGKPILTKSLSSSATAAGEANAEHRGSNASGRSTTSAACSKKKNIFSNLWKGGNKKQSSASQMSTSTVETDVNENKTGPIERKHKHQTCCRANKVLVNCNGVAVAVGSADGQQPPMVRVTEAVKADAKAEQLAAEVGELLLVLYCNDSGSLLRVRRQTATAGSGSGSEGWVPLTAVGLVDATIRASSEPSATSNSKNGAKKSSDDSQPSFLVPLPAFAYVRRNGSTALTCGILSKSRVLVVGWTRPDGQVIGRSGTELSWSYSDLDDSATLNLSALQKTHAGAYTCFAVTEAATVAMTATVNVGDSPAAPAKPQVTRRAERAVLLTWNPVDPQDDNQANYVYIIEVYNSEEKQWRLVTAHCVSTSHTLEDLADGSYRFRVRCANSFGISSPSEPSDEIEATSETEPNSAAPAKILWKTGFEQHFVEQKKLHDGKFYSSSLCKLVNSNTHVVTDRIRKQTRTKDSVTADACVLDRLSAHPRFCKLVDHFDTNIDWVFVFEHSAEGGLSEFMVRQYGNADKNLTLSEQQCSTFTGNLFDALLYLHTKRIVHLNLRPENVMLYVANGNWSLKLSGFEFLCSTDVPAEMVGKLIAYANTAAAEQRCVEQIEFSSPFMLATARKVKDNNADAKSAAVPSELAHADLWSAVLLVNLLLRGESVFGAASYEAAAESIAQYLTKTSNANASESRPNAMHLSVEANGFLQRAFDGLTAAREDLGSTLKTLRADKWLSAIGDLKTDELPADVTSRVKECCDRRLKYHKSLCTVCASESNA